MLHRNDKLLHHFKSGEKQKVLDIIYSHIKADYYHPEKTEIIIRSWENIEKCFGSCIDPKENLTDFKIHLMALDVLIFQTSETQIISWGI